MFRPVIGLLGLVAALGLFGVGLAAVAIGVANRVAATRRAGLRFMAGAVLGFGLLWVVGVLAAPSRVLAVGEEVAFCMIDCHLHVSVVKVVRAKDLAVTLRFRSDARGEPEHPGDLRFDVIDGAGGHYVPASGLIAEPLPAGGTVEREFRFAMPPEVAPAGLIVQYSGWMDYLVPGNGNPIAQRRVRLLL